MISRLQGTLVARELDRIQVMTAGGIGYEVLIPIGILELLPRIGDEVSLHTALVVKEDGWQLFGFASTDDRALFFILLGASGVGPALALGLISALGGARLVRAIRERDVATLKGVPRVGKKMAERLSVELGDKLGDFAAAGAGRPAGPATTGPADAVRALVSLGYAANDAEKAVAQALDGAPASGSTAEVIRGALALLQNR